MLNFEFEHRESEQVRDVYKHSKRLKERDLSRFWSSPHLVSTSSCLQQADLWKPDRDEWELKLRRAAPAATCPSTRAAIRYPVSYCRAWPGGDAVQPRVRLPLGRAPSTMENNVLMWTKRSGLTDRRGPTFGAQEGSKKGGSIWGNNERPRSYSFSQ